MLRRLSAMGDRLIVGVSTDEFNAAKGKSASMSFEQRCDILRACRYVDLVIPETDWDQKRTDIVNHNISLFGMSSEWEGQFDDLSDLTQVVYLPRTPQLSKTEVQGWENAPSLANSA